MTKLTAIEESDFQAQVLLSPLPVIVDFGAAWCSPCRMLEPVLEQIAGEWEGRLRIVQVDVDRSVTLVTQFQVMSVPTLLVFQGGQLRGRLTGYQPKDKVTGKLREWLK